MNQHLIEEEFFEDLFYFDLESKKNFDEFFYISKNYDSCPKCRSKNINQYKNVFLCFDCKYHDVSLSNKKDYDLDIENNYLIGINKFGKNIFFHRWLMKEEIKSFCKIYKIEESEVEVHHINHKRNHNYKTNLKVMTKVEHEEYHENDRIEKAYGTWCEKKYGGDYEDHWEEFCQWKENKGDNSYE